MLASSHLFLELHSTVQYQQISFITVFLIQSLIADAAVGGININSGVSGSGNMYLQTKDVKRCLNFSKFGFKIRIQFRFAYIQYSNLGLKFVHYFYLAKIGNS